MRAPAVVAATAIALAGCILRSDPPKRTTARHRGLVDACPSVLLQPRPGCYQAETPSQLDPRWEAPGDPQAALSSQQIEATIGQYSAATTCCYQRQLQRDPQLEGGRALLAWMIEPSGEVAGAWTVGNTAGVRPVADCVGEQICSWYFPPAEQLTKVTHWFRFELD